MDDAEKELNTMVVPAASAAKGFVSGVWAHSPDGKGVGVIVFESEQDAKDFVAQMRSLDRPGDSPVKLDSMEVYDLAATA
jgi:hypothetical protein